MSHTPPSTTSISIRDSTTPSRPPPEYRFLENPTPWQKYRVAFRHPAYPPNNNLLFTLYACDYKDGGIHHGLAHNACAILADNHFEGYLSYTANRDAEPITAAWDDILPSTRDYFFHVPWPAIGGGDDGGDYEGDAGGDEGSGSASGSALGPGLGSGSDSDSHNSRPYTWPVVVSFQDWTFPKIMPDVWLRYAERGSIHPVNTAPQSAFTAAVRQRDSVCQISGHSTATQVAHLIPEHEKSWFIANAMMIYNADASLDVDHMLRDLSNAVLLRSDLHWAFDERKYIFFPKEANCFVVHMIEPTPDLAPLYHNTRAKALSSGLEFLFARFAWTIFPLLAAFFRIPNSKRLVIRVQDSTTSGISKRIPRMITNIELQKQATASRSNSPKKRTRAAEDTEEVEPRKKSRQVQETSSPIELHDTEFDATKSLEATTTSHSSILPISATSKSSPEYFKALRESALALQRPSTFIPGMLPYDPQRPAREELEIMGVEILEGLEDTDCDWE